MAKKQKPDLSAIAAEVVENLNKRDTGELTALQYSKEDEIERVLAKHKIKRTGAVDEALMYLIGYADPFVTEEQARVQSAAPAILAAASRLMDAIGDDLPCECYGKPDAIYEKGEKCPPCELREAIKKAEGA